MTKESTLMLATSLARTERISYFPTTTFTPEEPTR